MAIFRVKHAVGRIADKGLRESLSPRGSTCSIAQCSGMMLEPADVERRRIGNPLLSSELCICSFFCQPWAIGGKSTVNTGALTSLQCELVALTCANLAGQATSSPHRLGRHTDIQEVAFQQRYMRLAQTMCCAWTPLRWTYRAKCLTTWAIISCTWQHNSAI